MSDKVIFGSDHAGYSLKEKAVQNIDSHEIIDLGPDEFVPEDDYPDYVIPVAEKVAEENVKGIIFGYSGQGEAIAANKVEDVRAAVYYGGQDEIISLTREHNDANILSMGAGFLEEEEALEVIERWLNTDFSGDDRHRRRLDKIDEYGNSS